MAVTLTSEQDTPLESFTHAVWAFTSNDPDIRKMSGQFTGRVGALGDSRAINLQVQPSFGGTALFEFDLQEFYRDNLSYDILDPATPTDAYDAPSSYFQLQTYQATELVDSSGQLVEGATLGNFTNKIVINAARQVYNPAGLDGYDMDGLSLGNFLTNNYSVDIRYGESYTLSLYSSDTGINAISVIFRNAAGTSVGSTRIPYSDTMEYRYDIAVGLENLSAYGVTIPANTASYRITVGNLTGSIFQQRSNPVIFTIQKACSGSKRVHFLNRWGGFDSYTFTGKNTSGISTSSTEYEKYLSNGFTKKDRGKQTQYRDVARPIILNTDILSPEDALWLEELVGTPVAYLEEDGDLIPIVINDQNVISEGDDLKQYTIEARYANNIRNQRL